MAKRISARAIKANRHYTYEDAALKLGNTVQTVRSWARQGLDVMVDQRPHLIIGLDLIAFIEGRQKPKTKMPLDQFYCLGCKSRSRPLDGIAFFIPQTSSSVRLEGFCGHCQGPCGWFVSPRDMPKINDLLEIVMNDAERT